MDKLRKWFNKPEKEVENQLRVRPLTSERSHDSFHDDHVQIRVLSSAPQRTGSPRTDHREILQVDFGQEQEVSFDQTLCRLLQTTDLQCSAAPPVCSSQVQGNKRTGGRRLPCSLPCSPLLGGRHWRSSSSSSSLSRLWLEEALQRSKNLRQNEPRPHLPRFTKVRPEGERGTTAEEGKDRWWDGGKEGYQQEMTENAVGNRPQDTVTFKPMTSSSLGGQESREEEGEEDEDQQILCLDVQNYCQLMPCVCDRCPSAPPFEAELVSGPRMFPPPSYEDLGHTFTQPSQRTDIQEPEGGSEESVPRDRVPHLGRSFCVYPGWRRITPGLQNRKQEGEVDFIDYQLDYKPFQTCYHGNNTDNQLMWLSAAELQTFCCEDLRLILKMMLDCSTCIHRTVSSLECCSICSNKLRNTKHFCTNCNRVHTHLCPC